MHQLLLARLNVDPPNVVIPRVAIVEADENFVRKLLADPFDLGSNALDRRQVLRLLRGDVRRVEMEVFVAVLVLHVQNVLVVIGPLVR